MFYSTRKIKKVAKLIAKLEFEHFDIKPPHDIDTMELEKSIQKYLNCNYRNIEEIAIAYWDYMYDIVGVTVDKQFFDNMKRNKSEKEINNLYVVPKKIRKILINNFG